MSNSEDTNILVRKMLKQKRSMRVPIIVGVVLAAVFAAFMVYSFGNKARDGGLTVDGPVYSGKTMTNRVDDQAPAPAGNMVQPRGAEEGGAAAVEVLVAHKEVTLWVDGKQLGTGAKHTLSLTPGKHVLMFQQKERTVMQKLTLGAGDSYRVEMRDKVTFTKLR